MKELTGFGSWLLTQLAHRKAANVRAQFRRLLGRPQEVQLARLLQQVRRERRTGFGRDHGFEHVRSLADFRRRVPVTRYEYFRPYIERVMRGENEALFWKQRVRMFAMTSGTTNARKYIPVTDHFLKDFRRGWLVWGVHLYETHPELWFRTMVQLVSDWDEERTPSNVPCGSISGLTAQLQLKIVRKMYCLPPESGKCKDVRAKYYLAWRLGLQRDVAVMMSANPSTLVALARFGDEHRELILRDLSDGTIDKRFDVPEAVRRVEARRLRPNPARARELDRIVSATGGLKPKDVWPNLKVLANWTGGSVAGYMRHYPEWYGSPVVRDLGLMASEGRMTVPVRDGTPGGILDIGSAFFEFVPVGEIDSPQPTALEPHELREGQDYYILLTTASGLYRYNIFDVVRCLGFEQRTPVLAFLNKGSNFSNLTGEKISEFQVVAAANAAMTDVGVRLAAFTLAPCWEGETPHYGLFVEEPDVPPDRRAAFAERVEARLREQNMEYGAKRDTHRLLPVRLVFLPGGFWQKWDRERLGRTGGTAEQYKHPCIVADVEFGRKLLA